MIIICLKDYNGFFQQYQIVEDIKNATHYNSIYVAMDDLLNFCKNNGNYFVSDFVFLIESKVY